MTRRCLRDPIPEIFEAARLLDCAVTAHAEGDAEKVAALLIRANMPVIREWTESLWGKNSAYVRVSKADARPLPDRQGDPRTASRMPDVTMRSMLLRRDGFHCRFCGIPVIRSEVRKLFVQRYPDLNLWSPSKNHLQHAAFQAMWLQYDHLFAYSRGGANALDNLVVTCAPCNFGRMEHSCESVGLQDPRERAPDRTQWDGLERFLPAAQRLPKEPPSQGFIDRMAGEPTLITPQCHSCQHWENRLDCKAFPDGIPLGVLMNTVDHRHPIEGDHGLKYAKKAVPDRAA